MEIVLQESRKIMTDSERKAEEIAASFKTSHKVKKAVITKKTKKGVDYWVVDVVIELSVEKEIFETYLAQE